MIVEIMSLAVTVGAVIFAIVVVRRPGDFRITRSLAIAAPASVAFAQVNDLHRWQAWSPWEGIDAELKRTYAGPAAGIGAKYGWEGKKTGAGAMTIAQSQEPASVRLDLDFLKPFKASNVVEFTFQPQGRDTLVSWTMTGKDTFVTKVFCMLCDRDKMCGDMFTQGLTKLKGVCEGA
jgi:Polyketide cyclase / dehydrase and lipid transport